MLGVVPPYRVIWQSGQSVARWGQDAKSRLHGLGADVPMLTRPTRADRRFRPFALPCRFSTWGLHLSMARILQISELARFWIDDVIHEFYPPWKTAGS